MSILINKRIPKIVPKIFDKVLKNNPNAAINKQSSDVGPGWQAIPVWTDIPTWTDKPGVV